MYWDPKRARWIAAVTVGYSADGKRVVRRASSETKADAEEKLTELIGYYKVNLPAKAQGYTVEDATRHWLADGLRGRRRATIVKCTILAETHLLPILGARQLVDLSADDVDRWLFQLADVLSARSLREVLSVLKRTVSWALDHHYVKRNVVLLCEVPEGRSGRPSNALTPEQAAALLAAAEGTRMHAYVMLALRLGARAAELRSLTWSNVDLDGQAARAGAAALPPTVTLGRLVRASGARTSKPARRTVPLPADCVDALLAHRIRQADLRRKAGRRWRDHDLVFPSQVGTPWDASHLRREFRRVVAAAGLDPDSWAPRDLRHSFVVLSSAAKAGPLT